MFNPVAKKIGDAMANAGKNQPAPKTKSMGKPVVQSKTVQGPSKDPVVMAEIAKRMKAQKDAENVVPKITRR